jgi:hypothetical protein
MSTKYKLEILLYNFSIRVMPCLFGIPLLFVKVLNKLLYRLTLARFVSVLYLCSDFALLKIRNLKSYLQVSKIGNVSSNCGFSINREEPRTFPWGSRRDAGCYNRGNPQGRTRSGNANLIDSIPTDLRLEENRAVAYPSVSNLESSSLIPT